MNVNTKLDTIVRKQYQRRVRALEKDRQSALRSLTAIYPSSRTRTKQTEDELFEIETIRETFRIPESVDLNSQEIMSWVVSATEVRDIEAEIGRVCGQILARICPSGNKEAKIRSLKGYLEKDLHAQYVAEAVGCCEVYARNFGWDDTREEVFEKSYARNRREQQVDSVRRNQVRERDGNRCVWCGEFTEDGQVHHVIPVSRGGADAMENLALLCRECHSGAHKGNGHGGVVYDSPDDFWQRSTYSTPPSRTSNS